MPLRGVADDDFGLSTNICLKTVLSQISFVRAFNPGVRDSLPRQQVELLRRTQFACRPQLTLADHVHEFDTGEGRHS
jgi:hypothetical protein